MPDEDENKKSVALKAERKRTILAGVFIVTIAALCIWYFSTSDAKYLLLLFALFILMGLGLIASAWGHTRIGGYLSIVFSVPLAASSIIVPYVIGVLGAMITSYLVASLIWSSIAHGSSWIIGSELPITAIAFATLTLTSIIMTIWGNALMTACERLMGKAMGNKVIYSVKHIDQKRIRVILFFMLFSLLVIFTFSSYIGISLAETPDMDDAILKSLVAFVAFDQAYYTLRELLRKVA